MNPGLLQVEHIGKTFGGRKPLEALRDVSLHVDSGEFVSIVGPSGSGKSTLFNLISGLESASIGRISVMGAEGAGQRRRLTGYMFQNDLLFPWRDLLANASLGLEISGDFSRAQARDEARRLLDRFGLTGFETALPRELSGGMRQRVALLRTLLLQRPLLLLDEPFASLDALTRRELQIWLRQTWREGSQSALLVTHDVREAVYLSDRVYVMSYRPGTLNVEIVVDVSPAEREDPVNLARLETRVLAALQSYGAASEVAMPS